MTAPAYATPRWKAALYLSVLGAGLGWAAWGDLVGVRVLTVGDTEPGTLDHCLATHLPETTNALAAQAVGRACRSAVAEGGPSPYAACILSSLDGMLSRQGAATTERACRAGPEEASLDGGEPRPHL
ncbi:hypothetical protein HL658_19485 [Azospirillum sp. RWY-5-1]|uniref:Uncharacterized protein n=1 Tax=Azospirillum oleiclasticum TaxID=2735135 RepID=A0ABX2TGN4_9PROT|nr:hypothetical protein [Azospirillum oleiclasticum]NYZ14736.1 hypothetical protein [Azospirillum oleiclasticum]NYZ22278.1 hypothetical protein [Azospirillum oleiclasticum]